MQHEKIPFIKGELVFDVLYGYGVVTRCDKNRLKVFFFQKGGVSYRYSGQILTPWIENTIPATLKKLTTKELKQLSHKIFIQG